MLRHLFCFVFLAAAGSVTASAQNPAFQYANGSVLTTSVTTASKGNLAVAFKETGLGNIGTANYALAWTGHKEVWGCAKNGRLNNGQPFQVSAPGGASNAALPVTKNGSITSTIYSNLAFSAPSGISCPASFTVVLIHAEYNGVTFRQTDGSGVNATISGCAPPVPGVSGCTITGNVSY